MQSGWPLGIVSCSIVLPVPRSGFRARFRAGVGQKPSEKGLKSGPRSPRPEARAVWDWMLVRSHWASNQSLPKVGPACPARGPEALVSNLI